MLYQRKMKWKAKKLKDSEIEILFEVSPEELNEFRERVILDLKKDFEMKGFRKGKAPKEIVFKEIGEEKIWQETVRLTVEESYLKYMAKEKIEPLSSPKIEVLSTDKSPLKKPFIFKVNFSVLPKIKLPDYRKITSEIKRRKVSVKKEEIENVIKQLQFSKANLTFKNGPAQRGDFVEIEYFSPKIEKGKKFKDAFILGKGFLIPGFEEKLEIMKAGQEKNFSLKFPEKHFQPAPGNEDRAKKDLAGKALKFNVKMKAVKKIGFPEINDAFARNLGNFEDLKALKKNIREGLKAEKEVLENQRTRKEILDKIREGVDFPVPEILIEREKDYLMEDLKKRTPEGLSFEDFLKKIKKSEEEISKSLLEVAEKRIKNSLIIREISEKEGLLPSEDEIKKRTNEILKNYPSEKTKDVDLDELKSFTKGVIIQEKIFQFLENVQKSDNSKNN